MHAILDTDFQGGPWCPTTLTALEVAEQDVQTDPGVDRCVPLLH